MNDDVPSLAREVSQAELRRSLAERRYLTADPADEEVYTRACAQLDMARAGYVEALERYFRAAESGRTARRLR